MTVRRIECGGMHWIYPTQDVILWLAYVKVAVNLWFH
jgi:hypothetical protein